MAMTLITTNTSSGASTSDFTSSIDSTYKLYIFKWISIAPNVENVFSVNFSADAFSNFLTKTTTYFRSYHSEADAASLAVDSGRDIVSGTGDQALSVDIGYASNPDSTRATSGELFLFDPSNTSYVKHFYATNSMADVAPAIKNSFIGGYIDTTSAVTAVRFLVNTGTFSGTIKLYGVG
jgi:hypothetical protein